MQISEAFHRIETSLNGQGAYDFRSILNWTGRFFFALRPWRFRRRMTGWAHLVAGVPYIRLPLGCSRLLSIDRDQDYENQITLVDAGTLMRARTSLNVAQSGSTRFLACEEWKDGVRRLALHRAPDETITQAYKIAYEAGWQDPSEEQCSDGNVALPIPDYAEPVFGELLEAYALGLDRQEATGRASPSQMCAEVLAGPLYAAAVEADMRAVPDIGPVTNTAVQMARTTVLDDLGSYTLNLDA